MLTDHGAAIEQKENMTREPTLRLMPLSAHETTPRAALAEVFADASADGGRHGFVLAGLGAGTVVWVQDRPSRREGGRPCAVGVAQALGVWPDLLHLEVGRPADVLWAMEEALGCPGLAAVVGEVWGEPSVLGFAATKRLALRAEASGVQAWLIRRAASPDLSAARERWRVASLASPGWDRPTWRATLFRSRLRPPAEWVASHDGRRLVLRPGPAGTVSEAASTPRADVPTRRPRPAA
jgi:protein ImuA